MKAPTDTVIVEANSMEVIRPLQEQYDVELLPYGMLLVEGVASLVTIEQYEGIHSAEWESTYHTCTNVVGDVESHLRRGCVHPRLP